MRDRKLISQEDWLTAHNAPVGRHPLHPSNDVDGVYLKHSVKLEPLVCHWYAWPHLIAPAQHAMNIAQRHLPLLQSFVANPSVHLAATRNPRMFGGPFVNLTERDVPDVQRLIKATNQRCAGLLGLARDLKDFDAALQETASGQSLHELYERLPDSLRGLLEVVYDLNHHPKLRLYEELLYDEYLGVDVQQICLSTPHDRERHFFMSTPRLEAPDNVLLPIAFSDERIDALVAMRSMATDAEHMAQVLEVPQSHMEVFRSFFTSAPPTRNQPDYTGDAVRVRHFGHACVLLQSAAVSILVDPMLAIEHGTDGRLTFDDLPDFIDYLVLTHNHQDHCSPEMLLQLRRRVGRVLVPPNNSGSLADPSMRLILQRLGYRQVHEVAAFGSVEVPGGRIVSLPFPGEHSDLDIHSRQSVMISLRGRHLLFLVDSDGRDSMLYRRILKRLGHPIDVLFLGMECHGAPLSWLYGPLLTKPLKRRDDESRRLNAANCERAWNVLQQIQAPRAFIYAMGQEPWLRYIMGLEYTAQSIQLQEVEQFLRRCREAGITAEMLQVGREFIF